MRTLTDSPDISVKRVPKGAAVFKQGDAGDAAYVVSSGAIAIYREADGQRIPLATVYPGGLFGEMAVIDGSPRMASAVAVEDTTLTVLTAAAVETKMDKADPLLQLLVKMLMGNLRKVHELYMPKPRTLSDVASTLTRQCEMVNGLVARRAPDDLAQALVKEMRAIADRIAIVRKLAEDGHGIEKRRNAVPQETSILR